jgi:hypothetical protein
MTMMWILKRVIGWGSAALVCAIFLTSFGAQAAAPVIALGELQGATGVNVGGAVYDAEFVDGSCIDVYDGCDDVADFPFSNLTDATLASEALLDQVFKDNLLGNFDTVPSLTAGCSAPTLCGAQTPFDLPNATDVTITSAVNIDVEASDTPANGDTTRIFDTSAGNLGGLTTYVVWTPVPPATPNVVLGELKGASGVNVGGNLYDVEFVEGTCIDLFDGCDEVSDFEFASLAETLLASQALLDQVFLDSGTGNFDTTPTLTFGCSGIFCGTVTPYGQPDASNMPAVSAVNFVTESSDVAGSGTTSRTYDMGASNLHELSVFAIWTPVAVPVPALPPIAQGVLIVALAGAAAVARKRR